MDTNLYGRRSIRLKGFDYSSTNAYFITICTQGRKKLFGEKIDGRVDLSPAGRMIQQEWENLVQIDSRISLDEFVVMPNHIHGIIFIGLGVGGQAQGLPVRCHRISVSDVVRIFKSKTTVEYIRGVHRDDWPPFDKRLWQRNYYEHIIRNEDDLNRVREYIRGNPSK